MKKNRAFLFVDDDPIFLKVSQYYLQNQAPDVAFMTAGNGEEALALLARQTHPPDMVLLDLNMPVMNGWDFLEALSKAPDRVGFPVIVTTSSIDPRDLNQAEKSPLVRGYIEKPLTMDKMSRIVNWRPGQTIYGK